MGRLDADLAPMLLDDSVHLSQTQAGTALALGGEERLEDAHPHVRCHSHASVGHLDDNPLVYRPRGETHHATMWHRVHGVEVQVRQCFT